MSVSPLDTEPAVGDRIVIRPAAWILLLLVPLLGGLAAVAAFGGFFVLSHGQPVGLLFVAVAVFCGILLYIAVG